MGRCFFFNSNFFFVFSIELEKFLFKYFFKKCFLRTNQEVDKDTKWCQKKHNQNRDNLQPDRTSSVTDIFCYPNNNTEPDNKDIQYYSTEYHIDIELSKIVERRNRIHNVVYYRKIVTIANQLKILRYKKYTYN